MISAGTDLLLTPGAAQIYYGDESNRPLGWNDWFTSDYKDQRYRTDMNWDSMDQKVLSHWQKVGQFRNKHLSVGAGEHQKLEGEAYTFSRTYHLEEDDEDVPKKGMTIFSFLPTTLCGFLFLDFL